MVTKPIPPGFPESWPPALYPNGQHNGGPWWVRASYTFGIPAGIAIFLLWFVTTAISGELAGLRSDVRQHMQDQSAIVIYLRAICLNLAETEQQRGQCELPR